jgi:hypothetical protein
VFGIESSTANVSLRCAGPARVNDQVQLPNQSAAGCHDHRHGFEFVSVPKRQLDTVQSWLTFSREYVYPSTNSSAYHRSRPVSLV